MSKRKWQHTMLSGQNDQNKANRRSCDNYCDRREHRETGGREVNFDSGGAGKHHRGPNWIGTWKMSIVLPVMGQWIGISHVGNRRWECTEMAYFQKHKNLGNSCMVKWCEIELKRVELDHIKKHLMCNKCEFYSQQRSRSQ